MPRKYFISVHSDYLKFTLIEFHAASSYALDALNLESASHKCSRRQIWKFYCCFFSCVFPLDMPREKFAKQSSFGILIILRYPFSIRRLLLMIGYYASLC